MKNCDNCAHGSYGLDCNSGIETLYCREDEYEHEVEPDSVCDEHQFIDGYECESNELTLVHEELDDVLKEEIETIKVFVKS